MVVLWAIRQVDTDPPLYLTDHGAWSIPTPMILLRSDKHEAAELAAEQSVPCVVERVEARSDG